MGCNICNTPHTGKQWDTELKLGTKQPRDAALFFNMTIDEVLEHLETHVMPEISESSELELMVNDPQYLLKKAAKIVMRLDDWTDFLTETEDLSPQSISQSAKLVKETRETLKFIAELQGKFNKGDTYHQQFVQIQGDYNQFTNNVLASVCPSCRKKLAALNDNKELINGIQKE